MYPLNLSLGQLTLGSFIDWFCFWFCCRSKTTQVITNSDPYSTIAHLHLDECTLADKPDYPINETFQELQTRIRKLVAIPPILDEKAETVREGVNSVYDSVIRREALLPVELQQLIGINLEQSQEARRESASISRRGYWLAFEGVTAYNSNSLISSSSIAALTLEEEIKTCFANLIGKFIEF